MQGQGGAGMEAMEQGSRRSWHFARGLKETKYKTKAETQKGNFTARAEVTQANGGQAQIGLWVIQTPQKNLKQLVWHKCLPVTHMLGGQSLSLAHTLTGVTANVQVCDTRYIPPVNLYACIYRFRLIAFIHIYCTSWGQVRIQQNASVISYTDIPLCTQKWVYSPP